MARGKTAFVGLEEIMKGASVYAVFDTECQAMYGVIEATKFAMQVAVNLIITTHVWHRSTKLGLMSRHPLQVVQKILRKDWFSVIGIPRIKIYTS